MKIGVKSEHWPRECAPTCSAVHCRCFTPAWKRRASACAQCWGGHWLLWARQERVAAAHGLRASLCLSVPTHSLYAAAAAAAAAKRGSGSSGRAAAERHTAPASERSRAGEGGGAHISRTSRERAAEAQARLSGKQRAPRHRGLRGGLRVRKFTCSRFGISTAPGRSSWLCTHCAHGPDGCRHSVGGGFGGWGRCRLCRGPALLSAALACAKPGAAPSAPPVNLALWFHWRAPHACECELWTIEGHIMGHISSTFGTCIDTTSVYTLQ
jgi:hypothetical protein